jgi:ABC-2 type transport system permease protein
MAGYVYLSTLRDFMRARRLVVWVLAAIVIAGFAFFTRELVATSATDAQRYTVFSSTFLYRYLALLAAIFSTAVIGAEVEQKTIIYLLTRPVPRPVLLIARTLAAATVTFALTAVAIICTSFAIFGSLAGPALRDLIVVALGAIAYCGLFTLVSLLINKSLTVCLLFAFAWELMATNMPGYLSRLTVYGYLNGFAQHAQMSGAGNGLAVIAGGSTAENLPGASTSMVVLLLIGIVGLALGTIWFSSFEYVPRED